MDSKKINTEWTLGEYKCWYPLPYIGLIRMDGYNIQYLQKAIFLAHD